VVGTDDVVTVAMGMDDTGEMESLHQCTFQLVSVNATLFAMSGWTSPRPHRVIPYPIVAHGDDSVPHPMKFPVEPVVDVFAVQ